MSFSPAYTIHQYREDIYKVVAFKGNRDPDVMYVRDREEQKHNDVKLDSNFSRARSMVLQYALCNPWEYFFTGTLDRAKFNRYDLNTYRSRLMQFILDKRKKYNAKFQVLLVPELHEDGAWHMHGLVHGLPEAVLTTFDSLALDFLKERGFASSTLTRLVREGYLNWPDYMDKFGFCSLAPIRDPVATAFYITKYVSKDLSRRSADLGKHLYFHSRPLQKAVKASDVYYYNSQLEGFCTEDYDFCKTGMVEGASWYFPYVWDGADLYIEPLDPKPIEKAPSSFRPEEIDPFYEQLHIDNFRL